MLIAPSLMTVTSGITAQAALPEHPGNGVERGFVDTQAIVFAAKCLDDLAAGWRESRLLNVSVLRALMLLTQRHPERAEGGFDPLEIGEAVGTVTGRNWIKGDTWDDTAEKVRTHWGNLVTKTWPTKAEGIRQRFLQLGLDVAPELSRDEGGGQGNPTRYCFRLVPLTKASDGEEQDESPAPVSEPAVRLPGSVSGGDEGVNYICEDVEDASWLARIFAQGFLLSGWRRHALRGVFIAGILVVFLALLIVPFTMVTKRSISESANALISAAVFGYAFWSTLGTLLMLHQWRIALAPWWMQSVDDDRLVEWRWPPRHPEKSIKAVRYTAKCTLCGGKVVARSGGLKHAWSLVGRCEEAPAAHVFSFDHVRREGLRLM
jgi:hypothetical protein